MNMVEQKKLNREQRRAQAKAQKKVRKLIAKYIASHPEAIKVDLDEEAIKKVEEQEAKEADVVSETISCENI